MKLNLLIGDFDHKTVLFIQRRRKDVLNKFFTFLTYTGTGRAWITVSVILNLLNFFKFEFAENQIGFLRSLISALIAWIMSSILKKIFSRNRPSLCYSNIVPLIQVPKCGSFPSSHAAASLAFFFALIIIDHPMSILVGIWAILVSFSRVYLGIHFPSDIAGGAFLAAIAATTLLFFQVF